MAVSRPQTFFSDVSRILETCNLSRTLLFTSADISAFTQISTTKSPSSSPSRCLTDSGGGMPPGHPPDPCPSTSAPSPPLPRARTWMAAASIQSGGEARFLGLTFHNIQHPGKCMNYSLMFIKTPPSPVPEDFINRQSFACNTC